MSATPWWDRASPIGGVVPARRVRVTADEWLRCAADLVASGARLCALWATPGGSIAPHAEVRAAAAYVTKAAAGHGAAREFCDLLLVASGRYAGLLEAYQ